MTKGDLVLVNPLILWLFLSIGLLSLALAGIITTPDAPRALRCIAAVAFLVLIVFVVIGLTA